MPKPFLIRGEKTGTPAKITAEKGDGKKLATFEMLAYNGGPMTPEGWEYPVICDLGGFVIKRTTNPIFRDHSPAKIVGHSTRIDVGTGRHLQVFGVISGTGPDAKEVVETSKNGFPWQASIGADPVKSTFIEQGETAEVNGITVTGPITISHVTELGEVSFVPNGADDTTSASIAAMQFSSFDESKHPRSDNGEFGDGGGESGKKKGSGRGKKGSKKEEPKSEKDEAKEKRDAVDDANEIADIYENVARENPHMSDQEAYREANRIHKEQKSKKANSNRKGNSMTSRFHRALKKLQSRIRFRLNAGKYTTHEPMQFSDEEIDNMPAKAAQDTLKKCLKAEEDAGMEAPDEDEVEGSADETVEREDREAAETEAADDDKDKKAEASRRQKIKASRDSIAAEEERQFGIRKLAREHGIEEIEIMANGSAKTVPFVAWAIKGGMSPLEAENKILKLQATRGARPGDGVGVNGGLGYVVGHPSMTDAVFEQAIIQAARHEYRLDDDSHYVDQQTGARKIPLHLQKQTQAEIKARYNDQACQAAHTLFRGRGSLQEIMIAAAKTKGYKGPERIRDGSEADELMSFMAGRREYGIRADAGTSTTSIPNIIANVLNKFMLQGYFYIEQAWREVSAIRPVNDFKPTKSINLLGAVEFQEVPPSGQLQNAIITDQAFANQADQYGLIVTINRRNVINDDLGILTTIPQKVGQGAGIRINDTFWTMFLSAVSATADDGNSFFATSRSINSTILGSPGTVAGNPNLLSSGSTSALSPASLQVAKQLFDKQIDPNGYPLGFDTAKPKLLFPPELWQTANALINPSATQIVYGGSTATLQPNMNVWGGFMEPVMSRYISNTTRFANASTSAWYVLFNPAALSMIETAFLNGVDVPTVQTAGPDFQFDRLGISIRGVLDFGVNLQNYRGAVKSPGA